MGFGVFFIFFKKMYFFVFLYFVLFLILVYYFNYCINCVFVLLNWIGMGIFLFVMFVLFSKFWLIDCLWVSFEIDFDDDVYILMFILIFWLFCFFFLLFEWF